MKAINYVIKHKFLNLIFLLHILKIIIFYKINLQNKINLQLFEMLQSKKTQ